MCVCVFVCFHYDFVHSLNDCFILFQRSLVFVQGRFQAVLGGGGGGIFYFLFYNTSPIFGRRKFKKSSGGWNILFGGMGFPALRPIALNILYGLQPFMRSYRNWWEKKDVCVWYRSTKEQTDTNTYFIIY